MDYGRLGRYSVAFDTIAAESAHDLSFSQRRRRIFKMESFVWCSFFNSRANIQRSNGLELNHNEWHKINTYFFRVGFSFSSFFSHLFRINTHQRKSAHAKLKMKFYFIALSLAVAVTVCLAHISFLFHYVHFALHVSRPNIFIQNCFICNLSLLLQLEALLKCLNALCFRCGWKMP